MAICVRNYPALLQIWPNLPDCVVGYFLWMNAKHRRKATCCFGKWFALKARKLPLNIYDARNTSVYHTLRLEFCTECMLSLNMGLAGLSEITRMSEIRRLYPRSLKYFWRKFLDLQNLWPNADPHLGFSHRHRIWFPDTEGNVYYLLIHFA